MVMFVVEVAVWLVPVGWRRLGLLWVLGCSRWATVSVWLHPSMSFLGTLHAGHGRAGS